MRRKLIGVLFICIFAAMVFPAAAHADKYWWVSHSKSGSGYGSVCETGPGLQDWSYVYGAEGVEFGSAAGHYALIMRNVLFQTRTGRFYLAQGRKLFTFEGRRRQIGYAKKVSRRWVIFKKTSRGWKRVGYVQGSAPACHALEGARCLLW